MMLLPCLPDLRVTGLSIPRPVLTRKNGHAIARFPAGLVLILNYGNDEVRLSVSQGLIGGRCALMSCDDDLDAEYLPLQLSDCGTYYFGRIAAAPDGLLPMPVGTTIGLTGPQCSDLFALLEDAVVDMARAAVSEVAA